MSIRIPTAAQPKGWTEYVQDFTGWWNSSSPSEELHLRTKDGEVFHPWLELPVRYGAYMGHLKLNGPPQSWPEAKAVVEAWEVEVAMNEMISWENQEVFYRHNGEPTQGPLADIDHEDAAEAYSVALRILRDMPLLEGLQTALRAGKNVFCDDISAELWETEALRLVQLERQTVQDEIQAKLSL